MFDLKITAHRGMGVQGKQRSQYLKGAKYYPENSMAAFNQAVNSGVNSLEFDIHVTKDGYPVVIHGNELTFYTYRQVETDALGPHLVKAKGKVEDYTLEELQSQFRLKLGEDRFEAKKTEEELKESIELESIEELKELKESIELGSIEELKESIEPEFIDANETILCETPKKLKQFEENIVKKELKKVQGKDAIEKLDTHIKKLFEEKKLISAEISSLSDDLSKCGRDEKLAKKKLQQKINKAEKKLENCEIKIKEYQEKFSFVSEMRVKIRYAWENYNKIDISYKKIPTLDEVLYYSKSINDRLIRRGLSLTINVELKGSGSGAPTMDRIKWHCENHDFDPACVVLLGGLKSEEYGLNGNHEIFWANEIIKQNPTLGKIRTIVMVSTDFLYGKTEGPDFDVPLSVRGVEKGAQKFIEECLEIYDGIDMSLFDYNKEVHKILSDKYQSSNKKLCLGFSATNWKGSCIENSPILPSECVLKAYIIAKELDAEVLVKVDEPVFFTFLYSWLNAVPFKKIFQKKPVSKKLILSVELDGLEEKLSDQALSFHWGIPEVYFEPEITVTDIFNLLIDKNYKPPRGERKEKSVLEVNDIEDNEVLFNEPTPDTPILFHSLSHRLSGSFRSSEEKLKESISVPEEDLAYPTVSGKRCAIM